MRFFKVLLVINIVILILIVPGFILLDKNLNRHNNASSPGVTKPSPSNTSSIIDLNEDDPDEDNSTNETVISEKFLPSSYNFKWEVLKDKTIIENYQRQDNVSFPNYDEYNSIEGITTFRGNNYRNSPSYGTAQVIEEKLEKVWSIKTGYIDIWTGVGWNGQPSIVKWNDDLKANMNIFRSKKNKDNLKEVIYGTLDGKIYFVDLEDGKSTRNPINIGFPLKGSVSVDPRGIPLLYSGQGIEKNGDIKGQIGFRIFSLIDQKQLYFINGIDRSSFRFWGAFDSTPLVHKDTDTLFECGENGILYSVKLNTDFDLGKGSISINPDVVKYRYTSPSKSRLGIENSLAAYKNLAYFIDNSGFLQCIDLNTLNPVWVRSVDDDTDSTIAIEDLGGSNVSLYTACEVDLQGENGYSYVRKINALTGELIWENKYMCTYNSSNNGGALASPVVGKNDISNLVIFNIAKAWNVNGSKLIAFDKKTGEEIWVINLDFYCWSSPVDIYTKDGKSYIIQCDSGGYMHLIEGLTGHMLDRIPLEANVEGSPAVYDDMIVVGTRGQKIWGIKVK